MAVEEATTKETLRTPRVRKKTQSVWCHQSHDKKILFQDRGEEGVICQCDSVKVRMFLLYFTASRRPVSTISFDSESGNDSSRMTGCLPRKNRTGSNILNNGGT